MCSNRVLVVAPHPDDETIGAGGTIARHVADGAEVELAVVTLKTGPRWPDGLATIQRDQTAAACDVLGIRRIRYLELPTAALNTVPHKDLTGALQAVVDEFEPGTVYLPTGNDTHLDHRLVFEAGLVVVRPLPGCPVRQVLAYEIAPTARYGPYLPRPTVFVDIADYLPLKLAAMRCYETELRDWPHLRSPEGLEALAFERGVSVGLRAAEAFEMVRDIRRET